MNSYTTKQGDKWDAIAYAQMGSCGYTDRLMRLNPQYISYYTLPAGIVLVLPDPEDNVNAKLPPWKKVST